MLLRGWIEYGTYPPGSLLPSATRLAEAHTVSKATARHALEVLVKRGHARHIESKPHQIIWRQAGLKSPIVPHEQGVSDLAI